MKKPTMVSVAGVVFSLGLAITGGAYGFASWKATQPTKDNFEKSARLIWEKRNELKLGVGFEETANQKCISISSFSNPDARSKAQQPLAWHLDFLLDAPSSREREAQLRQLDALSKVGLIAKSKATTKFINESKEVVRYALTDAGWASIGYSRVSPCFAYGTQRYLGISGFESKKIANQSGPEIYEVRSRVGFSSDAELAPWAKNIELQAEFPEIRNNLDGQEFSVLLTRVSGQWIDYRDTNTVQENKSSSVLPEVGGQLKREIDEGNKYPAPTIDEIKTLVRKIHNDQKSEAWSVPCFYFHVDELRNDQINYSIGFFSDFNSLKGASNVPYKKALGYLNLLSGSVPAEALDRENQFETSVLEITPSVGSKTHPFNPYCFPIGKPSLEFIDVQISEKNDLGWSVPMFRYKLKIMYKKPPAWMNDPVLLAEWPELKSLLERGYACEGKYEFNRKTRDKQSGGGGCWWALDNHLQSLWSTGAWR